MLSWKPIMFAAVHLFDCQYLYSYLKSVCAFREISLNMFFYYFDMVRPTDQEMTAIEEILYFAHSSKTGTHCAKRTIWRSTGVGHEADGEENCGKETLLWFLQGGMGEAGG